MSTHFNVEKAMRTMRRSMDAVEIPRTAPKSVVIQHRHREIQVLFLKMLLTEQNSGSEMSDIMSAMDGMMSNVLASVIGYQDEDIRDEIIDAFCDQVREGVRRRLDGNDNMIRVEFDIPEEVGGHA